MRVMTHVESSTWKFFTRLSDIFNISKMEKIGDFVHDYPENAINRYSIIRNLLYLLFQLWMLIEGWDHAGCL